jgi:hypothetical protein
MSAFVLSFVPSLASADDPALVTWAQQRVEAGLVKPLAARPSNRFSRVRPRPHQSRVRITQVTLSRDTQGREFVPFAIDVRFGSEEWRQNDTVGCVYRRSGALYVLLNDSYYSATLLLGKPAEPVRGVCQAARER